MFGFECFPPLLQGQKAFHAVTGAHVRGGIYSAVKAEWEHCPVCHGFGCKVSVFVSPTEIYHPQRGCNDMWKPQDQVQEEKLRCADILHRIQYASVVVLCY